MHVRRFVALIVAGLVTIVATGASGAPAGPRILTGALADGSAYRIEVPAAWNGVLMLYSHGYALPGRGFDLAKPFQNATFRGLIARGYALAASAYPHQGWAVQPALTDQMQLLDRVPRLIGATPRKTIAIGDSMGGDITVGLTQLHPRRFAGALPVCGALTGMAGFGKSVTTGLLAGTTLLQLPPATADLPYLRHHLKTVAHHLDRRVTLAQGSARGRARLALVAAFLQIPGWSATTHGPPDSLAQTQADQVVSLRWVLPFIQVVYADLAARISEPPLASATHPGALLRRSPEYPVVRALYAQAHLSLAGDLARLRRAPPYRSTAFARRYLRWFFEPSGALHVPTLTVHTLGDDLVPIGVESQYAHLVARAGDSAMLRQVGVARYGHCAFTPAEIVVAVDALMHRVKTGRWGDLAPTTLNARARGLGPLNERFEAKGQRRAVAPAFTTE